MRNGKLETYTRYEDIPHDLQHVIEFIPDVPAGPHTHDEHEKMGEWSHKLQLLMQLERSNSKNKR